MKGAYCLVIELKKDSSIKIGALGKIKFRKGLYCYVGSALNNLEKRVQRHLSSNKKLYWHIDYFLLNKNSSIKKVFYKESKNKEECKIARFVLRNSIEQIENFGCSDCSCKSHLFAIKTYDFLEKRFKHCIPIRQFKWSGARVQRGLNKVREFLKMPFVKDGLK